MTVFDRGFKSDGGIGGDLPDWSANGKFDL